MKKDKPIRHNPHYEKRCDEAMRVMTTYHESPQVRSFYKVLSNDFC